MISADSPTGEELVERPERSPRVSASSDGSTCRIEAELSSDLDKTCGTKEHDYTKLILSQLINVLHPSATEPVNASNLNAALAFVNGIQPRDELEAALATQLFAAHVLIMKSARKAASSEAELTGMHVNHVAKLSRAFAAQAEALQKYRNKGRQRITVERVSVYDGGQAVVGQVDVRPGSEG